MLPELSREQRGARSPNSPSVGGEPVLAFVGWTWGLYSITPLAKAITETIVAFRWRGDRQYYNGNFSFLTELPEATYTYSYDSVLLGLTSGGFPRKSVSPVQDSRTAIPPSSTFPASLITQGGWIYRTLYAVLIIALHQIRGGHYSSFAKRFGHLSALIVPLPALKAVGTLPVTNSKQSRLV